jgi:hypothetical protein
MRGRSSRFSFRNVPIRDRISAASPTGCSGTRTAAMAIATFSPNVKDGGGDYDWSNTSNWQDGALPQSGDDVILDGTSYTALGGADV